MFILKTPRWNGTNRHYEYRLSNSDNVYEIHANDADEAVASMEEYFANSLVFTTLKEAKEAAGPDSELHESLFLFPRS